MFGRVVAGLVHDLYHPIQNIGNNTRLLLREDLDAEARVMSQRTIERELGTLKRFMDDVLQHRQAAADRALRDGRQRVGVRKSSRRCAPKANGRSVTVAAHYADGPLDDRRRPLRARPRLSQPDHQRDPGDGAGRTRHRHDGAGRQPHRGARHRHRIGHSGRSAVGDLRRLRHDQAARPRARAWRSHAALSSSSTAPSPSRAKSDAARPSRCGFRRPPIRRPRGQLTTQGHSPCFARW